MNRFNGVGNLCTEVKLSKAGETVKASFKVAFNRRGKDKGADFLWVKTWGATAEACNTYLKKGAKVGVDGEVRTSEERDSEGKVLRNFFEINANQVEFLTPKSGSSAPAGNTDQPPIEDDDIPF